MEKFETQEEDLIDMGSVLVETQGSAKRNYDGVQTQLLDPIGMFID